MPLLTRIALFVLLALAPLAAAAQDRGAAPAAGLSADQARQLLGLLQDDSKRGALLASLRALAAQSDPAAPASPAPAAPVAPVAPVAPAAPAADPTPAPASGSAPAAATGAAPAVPAKAASPLVAGGLGDQLVTASAGWVQTMSTEVAATARAVTGFPAMVRWIRLAALDPLIRQRVVDAAVKSGIILGAGLAVQLAVRLLLRRFMRGFERAGERAATAPAVDETVLPAVHPRVRAARSLGVIRRLPGALLRAVLAFLPAAGFAVTTYLILGSGLVVLFTTKMIVLEAIHAWVLFCALVVLTRLLFTDRVAQWRLVDPGDNAAAFLDPWVHWLVAVAILGGALASVGGRLGLSAPAQDGLVKLSALFIHLGLVVLVWRARRLVARKLRPRPGLPPLWASLANTYADRWHWIASVLLIASWIVWAVQRQQGVEHVLTLFGLTFAVAVGARLVLALAQGSLDRAFNTTVTGTAPAHAVWARRASRYYPGLRRLVGVAVFVAAAVAVLQVWGYDSLTWFRGGAVGAQIVSALVSVLTILLVSLLVWEGANALLDRHLQLLSGSGQFTKAGRLRTLAPLLRTCLLGTILIVVGLTALSELGVNIAPLLAGAGIFGVAIGFGSQKLVQDFITGIFLLLENAMQVGEWVTVSGLSGTVENLSVRTIRLRAGDGSVHVIPFSSVTTVTNTNRGIGNAAVSVTVSIEEDVDRVGEVLKKIASEMRADPDYRSGIRADLALWGVDKVDASTVTLVGQIECTDAARWGVQREFNRRVKKRFQDLGIRLANPAQPWLVEEMPGAGGGPRRALPRFGVPGEGFAVPKAASDPGDSAASTTRSPPPAALGNTQ